MANRMIPTNNSPQSGFTLVEISIVLAIIGMIIGGVLAGQYTLRRSQLQSVVVDLSNFKSAYLDFKDTYGGMPGDILDAVDYWGTDATGACPTGTRVPKKETCNGNGDNFIGSTDAYVTWSEPWRGWQQLSDAGLITGTFSGVAGTGGIYASTIGLNVPRSKISNTGYTLFSKIATSGDADWYDIDAAVIISFGTQSPTANNYTDGVALTPREQSFVDAKMDDGRPALGYMRSYKPAYHANCASGATTAATYVLTYNSPACSIFYIID